MYTNIFGIFFILDGICLLLLDILLSLSLQGNRRGRGRMVVDLQLPVQSVSITTKVVSSNLLMARCTRDQ